MNKSQRERMYRESQKLAQKMNEEAVQYLAKIRFECDVENCRKDLLKRARCIVEKFIKEKLSGDINNLLTYNFADLCNDHTFGYCRENAFSAKDCEIVRAILTLVFDGVWPKDRDNKDVYEVFLLNSHKLDSKIVDELPLELQSRIDECFTKYYYNIGNMVLLPSALGDLKADSTEKCDVNGIIEFIHTYLKDYKQLPIKIYKQFYICKQSFVDYHDTKGFKRLINSLMLTDFVDENLKLKNPFLRLEVENKNMSSEAYFEAVNRFLNSYEHFITTRAGWMIYRLQDELGWLIY